MKKTHEEQQLELDLSLGCSHVLTSLGLMTSNKIEFEVEKGFVFTGKKHRSCLTNLSLEDEKIASEHSATTEWAARMVADLYEHKNGWTEFSKMLKAEGLEVKIKDKTFSITK